MFNFLKKGFKGVLNKFSKKVEENLEQEKTDISVVENKEVKKAVKEKKQEKEQKKISEKKPLLKKIKETITTTKISEKKFDEIFWDLELELLNNNVAVEVITKLKQDLKEVFVNKPIQRAKISEFIKQVLEKSIKEILSYQTFSFVDKIKSSKKPFVIVFFGINGSGKTTTIAKIINILKNNKLSCVVAASDTFRAAAIQQLQQHTINLNAKLIKHDYGADPSAVAFDAIEHAKAKSKDVVLIDTAGRMHSNADLVGEMEKIVRVTKPDLKIFVGESITGNDCIEQVKRFNQAIGIDAIILTKADVDEKGGTALSISYVTKKPILYLGTGQEYSDIKSFDKNEMLKELFSA